MKIFNCRICGTDSYSPLRVKEMMYGIGAEFDYCLCQNCLCLQIMTIPSNASDFYPKNYYSYSEISIKRPIKNWLRGIKRNMILKHYPIFSFLFLVLKRSQPLFWVYRKIGLKVGMMSLDVGAGSGAHVLELKSAGIQSVGIDPFIENDIFIAGELIVRKAELKDITQKYDIITFHHSFEHIVEQLKTLVHAKSILKPNGKILIRIPTISSWAFEEYQENWCQLDAPRHLFLHSHRSIKLLAEQANLRVIDLWCDSSETQFIASKQYQMGITLLDPKSYAVNKRRSYWSKNDVLQYKEKARLANQALKGDQICVVLDRG
jgi:SAM-dependent methyltransferase